MDELLRRGLLDLRARGLRMLLTVALICGSVLIGGVFSEGVEAFMPSWWTTFVLVAGCFGLGVAVAMIWISSAKLKQLGDTGGGRNG